MILMMMMMVMMMILIQLMCYEPSATCWQAKSNVAVADVRTYSNFL